MATQATLLALLDATLADMPRLSKHLLEGIGSALNHPRYLPLREAWGRRRGAFLIEFESSLRPRLARAKRGENPFKPKQFEIQSLDLLDERQALRDVSINHVAKLCQEPSTNELFQLTNFFKTLPEAQHGRDPNWLRPALFAQAMCDALWGTDLSAQAHYDLMQGAGNALSASLNPLYRQLAEIVRQAKLTELVSGPEAKQPALPESGHGALDTAALERALAEQQRRLDPVESGADLFSRLYLRILNDPALLPPVKAQLARLQKAVGRLAQADPTLLHTQDNPAWRLINAVAAYGAAFESPDDERLKAFLQFLAEQTRALIDAPNPSAQQFEGLRRLLDAFIARQARSNGLPSQAALAAIERDGQRAQWTELLHSQLDVQLRVAAITPSIRTFLQSIWMDVIVQAMVSHGHESAIAQRHIQFVDDLIDSLQPHPDSRDADQLRKRLPGLISQLEQGLDSISLSAKKRQAIVKELAKQHSQVLSGKTIDVPPAEALAPFDPNSLGQEAASSLQSLLAERESAFASVWAHANVDRATLPTQPNPLNDTVSPAALAEEKLWLHGLNVGGWLHLCIRDHWLTAQLVWTKDDGQLYLFVGQDPMERHTLTRGALVQLYRFGLAVNLEQEALVERAMNQLMQDLA